MSKIISRFKFLKELSEETVQAIKFLYVFDNFLLNKNENIYTKSGNNFLIITMNDECYGFGLNSYGVLGFGHNISVKTPLLVEELCGKNIVEFVSGVTHCMALSSDGIVYCFGSNNFGQIGINSFDENYHKPIVNSYICDQVISICCGYGHSLALSKQGEIYAWGCNRWGQVGNEYNEDQLIPVKLKGFNMEKIKAISTGSGHSVALTLSGSLYSWGDNSSCQLGIGNNYDSNNPKLVTLNSCSLNDIIIAKVQCGLSNTVVLTTDGDIFEFRLKKLSQIGISNRENLFKPLKVNIENKCKDIASHSFYNISMALSADNKVYIWGNWNSLIHENPIETKLKSFTEIFIDYLGITQNTYKLMN